MKIEEGSKVELFINSDLIEKYETIEDIEIEPNQLIMQIKHTGLVSTDGINPIEKVGNKHYKVYTCLQDTIAIKDGYMFKSVFDVD